MQQGHGEASSSLEISYRSSKREIFVFFSFFGLFAFLDPDPRTQWNPEPSGLPIQTSNHCLCERIFIVDGDSLLDRKPLLQDVQFACDVVSSVDAIALL